MQKALVTGAGGYLASRLARILAEDGVHVRALFRSKSNADLVHPNIELVHGDLTDLKKLPEIVQGCSHVFHTAAFASNWAKDPGIFYKMNVDMAIDLFKACFENGVQRVVFTSSAGVIGPSDDASFVTETHQRKTRFFGDYEKSKFEAEQKVQQLIAEKGFDKQYGARPLKRAIQKYIEDALAEEIITSHVQDGDSIIMDLDEKSQELKIKIEKAEKPAES